MVAIKSAGIARFVQSPPKSVLGAVLYGSDRGQISANAESLIAAWRNGATSPTDVIKLHEADLSAAPERVPIELQTLPMFSGMKIVWLTAAPAATHGVIIETAAGIQDARLLVQAPDARKSSKLVQTFEEAPHLAAVACYGEDKRDVLSAIRAALSAEGCDIEPDALALLYEKVGNAQLAALAEIEKLIAFSGEARRISAADVAAIIEDQTEAGFDDVIGHALDGNAREALAGFDRFTASGNSTAALLTLLQSRLMRLHDLRAAADAGEPVAAAVKKLRPPVFFKQQDALIRQCDRLSAPVLTRMIADVADALKGGRTKPQLGDQIAAHAILRIATRAHAANHRGGGATPGRRLS